MFTLSFETTGVFGQLPLFTNQTRKRRQAELAIENQIQNPTLCVQPGEMVMFNLNIDQNNRDNRIG